MDPGLQFKEKSVKYKNRFLEKKCKDLQITKSKKWSHQRKMQVTQIEKGWKTAARCNCTDKQHAWRITDGLRGRRKEHNDKDDPKYSGKREVEKVMKQRNLISDDAINQQLWPLKNSNWWTTGKKNWQIDLHRLSLVKFNIYNVFPCPIAVTLS
jgi:hypothetical protein